MADDERDVGTFKPGPALLAGLLDRAAAERHAEAIAKNPQIAELREELDRIEAEARLRDEERARQPAPASEKAEHVEAAVPQGEIPRITASKVKIATEVRRLRPPPTIVHDDSPRGMPTMELRVLAPVATTDRRRVGGVVAAVAILLVGVGVAAVVGLGANNPPVTGSAALPPSSVHQAGVGEAGPREAEPTEPTAPPAVSPSPPSAPSAAAPGTEASRTPPPPSARRAPASAPGSPPSAAAPSMPSATSAAPPSIPSVLPTVKHNPVFEFGGDTDR